MHAHTCGELHVDEPPLQLLLVPLLPVLLFIISRVAILLVPVPLQLQLRLAQRAQRVSARRVCVPRLVRLLGGLWVGLPQALHAAVLRPQKEVAVRRVRLPGGGVLCQAMGDTPRLRNSGHADDHIKQATACTPAGWACTHACHTREGLGC